MQGAGRLRGEAGLTGPAEAPEMTHSATLRTPLSRLALTTAVLLPAVLLGGCDAIYDDTKGWANRLEAEVLETAHEMGEPDPEEMRARPAGEPAPPAVPLEAVETARLTPPPPKPLPKPLPKPGQAALPALLPMTPDPGMTAAPAGTAEAAPAPVPGLLPMTPDPGTMAQAAEKNGQKPSSAQETKDLPPKPKPKPKVPATAQGKPGKGSETPAQTAAAGGAQAVVLHLSSLRSAAAAQREWSDLQQNFPRALAGMAAEIKRTELGDKGTFYRVLAGPLPSRDTARQVCAALKAKDSRQYCRILPPRPKDS